MISIERCRAAALAVAAIAVVATAAPIAKGAEPAAWEHRKFTMYYFGLTTLFTCDGLEDHVRQILAYWGARKDMTVRARGCMHGINDPSRSAWVSADFYSLMPAGDSPAPGVVSAEWKSVELSPHHPNFMEDGDCELMERLKDYTLKNFSIRNVDYHASCVPREVRMASYSARAQALQLVPPAVRPANEASGGR